MGVNWIWILLALGMAGLFWGVFLNGSRSRDSFIKSNSEFKEFEQLLEESVLVREDLEKLLAEASKVSRKIVDGFAYEFELGEPEIDKESKQINQFSPKIIKDFGVYSKETVHKPLIKNLINAEVNSTSIEDQKSLEVAPVQWKQLAEFQKGKEIGAHLNWKASKLKEVSQDAKGTKNNPQALVNFKLRSSTNTPMQQLGPYAEICQLAEAGFSVLQIAEKMGLGQGEVQLVLNVYGKTASQIS